MDISKFTRYFGGEYMKYWYAACVIILLCVAFSMYSDSSVSKYKLIIFNPDGSVKSESVVDRFYLEMNSSSLPVEKMIEPVKLL